VGDTQATVTVGAGAIQDTAGATRATVGDTRATAGATRAMVGATPLTDTPDTPIAAEAITIATAIQTLWEAAL
ncbi:hypothetical protein, partial [Robiginitalea sp.]|uniref:hypothetical protein n=1 Tax=Robiginitalea sp. TaxID=1902411 RepID=UPI003C74AF80